MNLDKETEITIRNTQNQRKEQKLLSGIHKTEERNRNYYQEYTNLEKGTESTYHQEYKKPKKGIEITIRNT